MRLTNLSGSYYVGKHQTLGQNCKQELENQRKAQQHKTAQAKEDQRAKGFDGDRLLRVVVALGLGKPGEEGLGRLPHLLAGWEVDVLLAGLGAPFGEDLLAQDI